MDGESSGLSWTNGFRITGRYGRGFMTTEIDVYRSAKLFVDRYGDGAGDQAAMRADALHKAGDLAGYALWRRVLRAIEVLQTLPMPGERRH